MPWDIRGSIIKMIFPLTLFYLIKNLKVHHFRQIKQEKNKMEPNLNYTIVILLV